MEKTSSTWPPPFTLEKSARAVYIRIKISATNGIKLVVPQHVPSQEALTFFHKKRDWIEKQLDKISILPPIEPVSLPQELNLLAINEKWQVRYISRAIKHVKIIVSNQQLILTGNIANQQLCFKALAEWLKNKAFINFVPWLTSLKQKTGLNYQELTIRGQTTRWGSCSSKQNISLNYKLLFLPVEVVEYVMVHELCHIKHLNHSKRFWQLVNKFSADHKNHCKFLRNTEQYIPRGL